ncbi:MAG: RdgB/HAM1 family non-canonical purine NTP pyrophosphatase [Firmicutes bacterium]|nr:RdgB/HAM1 family non-canonical purine NTP pyrophosphatase [Bacillota bacterium]
MTEFVMATQNKGKLAEVREIIEGAGARIISMADAGLAELEIEENGATCIENSFIKADTVCRLTGKPALADDTGLFVAALGGAPGVHAARYAGEVVDEAANRALMLKELSGRDDREAYFLCVLTLVYPDGEKHVMQGKCPGHIALEEKGDFGFGYDSIFVPDEDNPKGLTFAEMGAEEKNRISHRAKALALLKQYLAEL